MESMTIHTVFCDECGGWEAPIFEQIVAHEGHIRCKACGYSILLVRTEEPKINN